MNKVTDSFTEEVVDQLAEAFTRVAASLKVGGKFLLCAKAEIV